jgi:hypothetical protein
VSNTRQACTSLLLPLDAPRNAPLPQVAAARLFALLAERSPEVVPAATVLRMAEHALDVAYLAAWPGAGRQLEVLLPTMHVLRGQVSCLDLQAAVRLSVSALQYAGTVPACSLRLHVDMPAAVAC